MLWNHTYKHVLYTVSGRSYIVAQLVAERCSMWIILNNQINFPHFGKDFERLITPEMYSSIVIV